ncbi:hypothetical protein B7463_g412, partial [Scytalidium lignicola]
MVAKKAEARSLTTKQTHNTICTYIPRRKCSSTGRKEIKRREESNRKNSISTSTQLGSISLAYFGSNSDANGHRSATPTTTYGDGNDKALNGNGNGNENGEADGDRNSPRMIGLLMRRDWISENLSDSLNINDNGAGSSCTWPDVEEVQLIDKILRCEKIEGYEDHRSSSEMAIFCENSLDWILECTSDSKGVSVLRAMAVRMAMKFNFNENHVSGLHFLLSKDRLRWPLPDKELAMTYINAYFEKVQCVLPLLDRDEFMRELEIFLQADQISNICWYALYNAVMALGYRAIQMTEYSSYKESPPHKSNTCCARSPCGWRSKKASISGHASAGTSRWRRPMPGTGFSGSCTGSIKLFLYAPVDLRCGEFENLDAKKLEKSVEASVKAARNIILLTRYVDVDNYTPSWLLFYYPFTALTILFSHVIANPLLPTALNDIALMDVVTGVFGRMDFVSSGLMSCNDAGEFARLARATVERAISNHKCQSQNSYHKWNPVDLSSTSHNTSSSHGTKDSIAGNDTVPPGRSGQTPSVSSNSFLGSSAAVATPGTDINQMSGIEFNLSSINGVTEVENANLGVVEEQSNVNVNINANEIMMTAFDWTGRDIDGWPDIGPEYLQSLSF